MTTNNLPPSVRLSLAAAVLAACLSGCSKPAPPATEPTPPAPNEVPATPAPSKDAPAPDAAAPAPAPAPNPPPPTEPSPVAKPTASAEPSVQSMHVATASAKISVPVELRYQFDGEVLPDQPVTLQLAAVSRVPGAHLQVTIKQVVGLQIASGPLQVQKVDAQGVYRQAMSITRSSGGPENLRILVTMDLAEGSGFGYFTVPLSGGNPPQKLESVKQR